MKTSRSGFGARTTLSGKVSAKLPARRATVVPRSKKPLPISPTTRITSDARNLLRSSAPTSRESKLFFSKTITCRASNVTRSTGSLRSSEPRDTRKVASRLRQYVSARRRTKETPQVFLPLEFEPGQDAQVDWGEAVVDISGQKQKVQFFVMHLCYSRRTFAACFPSQNQESFFWAHIQAFRHFGGVPHRISYDNRASAVKLILDKTKKRGRTRQENRSFTSFRGYYLFESHFCTIAKGNEKGGVEGSVGYTRRNFMVPLPTATSFEDLNQQVLKRCLQEDARTVARETQTIGEAWEKERSLLLPLPPSDYECCDMVTVRLNPYSQAKSRNEPVFCARQTRP